MYVTTVEAEAYLNSVGVTEFKDFTSAKKDELLKVGTTGVDTLFRYQGIKPKGQELHFPNDVFTTVPVCVKQATNEYIAYVITSALDGNIKSESIGSSLSVTYKDMDVKDMLRPTLRPVVANTVPFKIGD